MIPEKNSIHTLTVTSVTPEGDGVARLDDGYVLFVPCAVQGDEADIRVVKTLASYGYGKLEKLISPSEHRCAPECAYYGASRAGSCGGCSLRHVKYEYELEIKKNTVDDNFRRIGGFGIACDRIIPSPKTDGYRNKAQYPAARDGKEMRFGFYSRGSHTVSGGADCPLQPEFCADIAAVVAHWCKKNSITAYDEESGAGLLRCLYIRHGQASGEIMVCLVINGDGIPDAKGLTGALTAQIPGIASIVLNINQKNTNVILGDICKTIWGKDTVSDRLCGIDFNVSPLSFCQVNHDGAERLYTLAGEFAGDGIGTLIDLYCGTGTIGMTLAKRAKRVIGIEIVPEAIADAEKNAAENGIDNIEFICSDAGKAASELVSSGVRPDCVILDPPRKGCDSATLEAVARLSPARIVMISCNSATAARDCRTLAGYGYTLQKLTAVDMFPRTGHVETVVLMSRKDK